MSGGRCYGCNQYVGSLGSDNLEKLFFQVAPKEDMRRAEVVNMNNTFTVYWNLNEQNNGHLKCLGQPEQFLDLNIMLKK